LIWNLIQEVALWNHYYFFHLISFLYNLYRKTHIISANEIKSPMIKFGQHIGAKKGHAVTNLLKKNLILVLIKPSLKIYWTSH